MTTGDAVELGSLISTGIMASGVVKARWYCLILGDRQQKNRHIFEKSFDIDLRIFKIILISMRKICKFEIKYHTACTLVVSGTEINIIKISFTIYYKYL